MWQYILEASLPEAGNSIITELNISGSACIGRFINRSENVAKWPIHKVKRCSEIVFTILILRTPGKVSSGISYIKVDPKK